MTPPTDLEELLTVELLLGTISAPTILEAARANFPDDPITGTAHDWSVSGDGWALSLLFYDNSPGDRPVGAAIYDDQADNHHALTVTDHAEWWAFLETVRHTVIAYKYTHA
jgi:hypothetical protein